MEFAFVSGISGIGKSYLIHEFQKLIQQQNGLFIYGKFDQFKRATPYTPCTKRASSCFNTY
ncbi:AAA family ATPase [Paenibacillus validus]|uniref:AAA family ATPase n=1 Tax=Paenibacillus validus TaxID=44253 RepID=UPI003D2B2AC1